MSDEFCYETIDECEKAIISKLINVDIMLTSNWAVIDSFSSVIRIVFIINAILVTSITYLLAGGDIAIKVFSILALLYVNGVIIMGFSRYSYMKLCSNIRKNIFSNMLVCCEEYHSNKYNEWQRKQIVERMINRTRLVLDD